MTEQYANILVERRGRVGLVTLNRPEALNALNKATMEELVKAVTRMDAGVEPTRRYLRRVLDGAARSPHAMNIRGATPLAKNQKKPRTGRGFFSTSNHSISRSTNQLS